MYVTLICVHGTTPAGVDGMSMCAGHKFKPVCLVLVAGARTMVCGCSVDGQGFLPVGVGPATRVWMAGRWGRSTFGVPFKPCQSNAINLLSSVASRVGSVLTHRE